MISIRVKNYRGLLIVYLLRFGDGMMFSFALGIAVELRGVDRVVLVCHTHKLSARLFHTYRILIAAFALMAVYSW
jgi:hypothetical protein